MNQKVNDREKTKLQKDIEIVISEPIWEQMAEEGKEEAAMDFLLCFITIGNDLHSWTTKDPDFYGFCNYMKLHEVTGNGETDRKSNT